MNANMGVRNLDICHLIIKNMNSITGARKKLNIKEFHCLSQKIAFLEVKVILNSKFLISIAENNQRIL